MKRLLLFFTVLALQGFLLNTILAERAPNTAKAKSFTLEKSKIDSIRIKGFEGNVRFVSSDKENSFSLKHSGFNNDFWTVGLKIIKEGGKKVALFEITGPEDKARWPKKITEYPKLNITVTSPSKPVELFWKKGHISFSDWSSDIFGNLQNGKLEVEQGKAKLDFYVHSGEVTVLKREGSVNIDTYKAKVHVEKLQGEVVVDNYAGVTQIKEAEANIQVASQKGTTTISNSNGKLNFKNGQSPMKILNFDGSIRGASGQGLVQARLKGEVDVRIRSVEGPIDIRTKNSGARVNLGTKEGNFSVASYLKLTRYPTLKVMSGRLRGNEKGYVFVRTESGQIRVR